MNIVEKILKTKESLDGVNKIMVCMVDGEMFCNLYYKDEIETIHLPRLLTDGELMRIGNIEQHNIDCGIHKSCYDGKIKVRHTEPI